MFKPMPLYRWFAQTVEQHARCVGSTNTRWSKITKRRIDEAVKNGFPSGSGFDCGTRFDLSSHVDQFVKSGRVTSLRFIVEFHHMNEVGSYDGWTAHTVTVKPSLASGFDLSVSGPNRNEIKDYIADTFHCLLCDEVIEFAQEGEPTENYEFRRNGSFLASADYKA